jgi:hypothetical protein
MKEFILYGEKQSVPRACVVLNTTASFDASEGKLSSCYEELMLWNFEV